MKFTYKPKPGKTWEVEFNEHDFPIPAFITPTLDKANLELVGYVGKSTSFLLAEALTTSLDILSKVLDTEKVEITAPSSTNELWRTLHAVGARFGFDATSWLSFARVWRLADDEALSITDRFYYAAYLYQLSTEPSRDGMWLFYLFQGGWDWNRRKLLLSREQVATYLAWAKACSQPAQSAALGYAAMLVEFKPMEVASILAKNPKPERLQYYADIHRLLCPGEGLEGVREALKLSPELLRALMYGEGQSMMSA